MRVTRDPRGDPRARPPTARLIREPLPGDLDGIVAAGWLRDSSRGVALSGAWLGGTTILTSHPLLELAPDDDPFAALDGLPVELELTAHHHLAVGGGWFGWLGFGLAGSVEPVPPAPPRPLMLPAFDLAFHDHLVLRDGDGHWWFEALWTEARASLLEERLDYWRERVATGAPPTRRFTAGPLTPVAPGLAGHHAAVSETIQRIAAGEHSQSNICLRFETGYEGDPLDVWTRAAGACEPAYGAYIAANAAGHAVVSLSPELFLRRAGRRVETRPIKGTAPLSSDPTELTGSAKDRAENVMIVDLMRNDLGRVCRYGSVVVENLCALRPAPGVWQLESTVAGELRSGVTDAQLLRATFPPGSVTGAPKVQALRTIHALEASGREAYCGAIGVRSPIAGLELSVAIRTFELAGGRLWLGAGGGIVSDSSPEAEVDEALTKARGAVTAAGLTLAADRVRAERPRIPFARTVRPDPAAGVLETVRVSGGRVLHAADHLARLASSAVALGLRVSDHLESQIDAAASELTEGALRITASPGGTDITPRPLPRADVMELVPLTVPGGLGAHKWADRRLIEAHSGPGVTPLICDSDGSALEAGYAAVVLVSGAQILAPPLDGRALPSLSRERLLRAAADCGWEITLRQFSLADVAGADAIILTSSLRAPHPGRLPETSLSARAAEVCEGLARVCEALQPA